MTQEFDAPDPWFEMETRYDFQDSAFRNGETGRVIVVEESPEQMFSRLGGHNVVILSEDYQGQPEPVEYVAEDIDELQEAREIAFTRMQN